MMRWKHEVPEGILENDEVCIGWATPEGWRHMHHRTKRFCYATMQDVPGSDEPELCIGVVVKKQEMIENGWSETPNGFYQHFSWENI